MIPFISGILLIEKKKDKRSFVMHLENRIHTSSLNQPTKRNGSDETMKRIRNRFPWLRIREDTRQVNQRYGLRDLYGHAKRAQGGCLGTESR